MIRQDKVLPYYHPTTVFILDDDPEFLDSFLFRYRRRFSCRAFREPEKAIDHLHGLVRKTPRHADCLQPYLDLMDVADWQPTDQGITFKPALIRELVHDATRFADVSVAIIDYDMPGLDGLEVCRRLRDLPVKKLMLTGKADEKLAMAAFNEGLIDRFLIKQEATLTDRIEITIAELQRSYFERNRLMLESILGMLEHPFLADSDFCRYFAEVLKREQAVEYYLSANPPGMLLVRADGTVSLVLVQDDKMLRGHAEMARDTGAAPRDLLAELDRRDRQPWFPTELGTYEVGCFAWEPHMYPAERVGPWYCSVIGGDAARIGLVKPILSYDDYRRRPTMAEA